MKKWLIMLCAAMVMLPMAAVAEEEVSAEEFMARARRRNTEATYAKLYGSLQHRRRGKPVLTMPVYFGTIIEPDKTFAQLILNGNEGYMLTQASGSGFTGVQKMPNSKNSDNLGYVGVRASDLVMSFLFCKVEKEFDSELLSGMVHCRVFLLDDKKNKEKIKVWISSEHAFPLKAEFYRYGENKRFRELEAGALTKKNELYYVRRIRLEGPGWITRIDFSADKAEINKLPSGVKNKSELIMIPLK